jgi:thiol-disulfide isomerase/thioredoxin
MDMTSTFNYRQRLWFCVVLLCAAHLLHSPFVHTQPRKRATVAPPTNHPTVQVVQVVNFEQLQSHLQPKRDTLTIINFWATWCKPCVEELPHFQRLQREQPLLPTVIAVTFVSLDFKRELERTVQPFAAKRELGKHGGRVLLLDGGNPNGWIDRISNTWSGAIPATLGIAPTGKTLFKEASFTYDELKAFVQQLQTP